MAGSSSTITYDDGQDGAGYRGNIRRITMAWLSDDTTGTVVGTTRKIVGHLLKGVTVPGTAANAPTDNYDIAITDEQSVNVLTNCKVSLIDRDTATTEEVYFMVKNSDTTPLSMAVAPVVCDKLTITVTNAGSALQGTVYIYYRPL